MISGIISGFLKENSTERSLRATLMMFFMHRRWNSIKIKSKSTRSKNSV